MLQRIRQFLGRLFFENILLKCISLIIAFLLWGFLMLEKKSEMVLTIPIRVENIPARQVMTEPPPTDLRVVVRGTRTQFGLLDHQLPYIIDLTDAKPGISVFDVIAAKIMLPRGLQIVHMSPAQISIRLSPAVSKTLPVVLRYRGELPSGYTLRKASINPEMITIDAAKEELEGLKSIETEPIDLSAIRGDIEVDADLATAHLHILDITTHVVEVTLDVDELMSERIIPHVPVRVPAGMHAIGRGWVDLTVRGPSALVTGLSPASFSVYVDPRPKPGRYRAPVRVESPSRIAVSRISPPYLEVSP